MIDELAASGIRAELVRRRDGKLNVDDLFQWLRGEESAEAGPELMYAVDAMTIDVAGIDLKDTDITLRDEQQHSAWQVSGLSVSTGPIVSDTPVEVKLAASIRDATSGQGARVTARGLVSLDLQGGRIDTQDLVVVAKGDWRGNDWFPEPVADLEAVLRATRVAIQAEPARVTLDRLAVRAKGQQAGGNPVEFSLDTPAVLWADSTMVARAISSRLRVEGPVAADIVFAAENVSGKPALMEIGRLETDLTVRRPERSTRAILHGPVQVKAESHAVAFPAIRGAVHVKFTDPKIPEVDVNVNGHLAVDAGAKQLLAVRGGFESIPFNSAWSGMGIDSPLDGIASIQFDLTGAKAGGMPKFAETLAGTVQLKIDRAAIRGIDFAEGMEALRAIARPTANGVQFKGDPAKHTQFESVDLAMRIKGPEAILTKLDLNGSNWRVVLGKPSEVNLRDGTADLGVTLHLRNPQPVTVGKVTVEVRSLMVPLRLSGPLTDPLVDIDWKDLGRDRLGMALRQKLLEGVGAQGAAGAGGRR